MISEPSTEKRILVVGSINIDFVVKADRLPKPGESVVGTEFFQAFGGKGANQAVGISRLNGPPVSFVGAVGKDSLGDQAIASLLDAGIDCRFVTQIPELSSGVALIMLDKNGENCITAAPGANSAVDEYVIGSLPDELFRSSQLIVVCQEIPVEAIVVLVERAKLFQVPVQFNPAPPNERLKDADILQYIEYLTPNETEVEALTGRPIQPEDLDESARSAISDLRNLGARSIAITLGANGCYVFDEQTMSHPDQALLLRPPKVDAVDTTAAGDAFNAGLAVATCCGKSFVEACRWANRVAATSVTRKGAQPSMPTQNELVNEPK